MHRHVIHSSLQMNEISWTTPFKNFSLVGFYREFVLGLLRFEKKMKTELGFHLSRMSRARRKKSLWILREDPLSPGM